MDELNKVRYLAENSLTGRKRLHRFRMSPPLAEIWDEEKGAWRSTDFRQFHREYHTGGLTMFDEVPAAKARTIFPSATF